MAFVWIIKTGCVPACSEPRTGLSSASQISPRLTIIKLNPHVLNCLHTRLNQLRQVRGLRQKTHHIKPQAQIRQIPVQIYSVHEI